MTTHNLVSLSNSTGSRLTPNGIHSGLDITIQNQDGSAYVYIGGEGVSIASYGYRLAPSHTISFELPGQDALYAVSDTNESVVSVLMTGLESGS